MSIVSRLQAAVGFTRAESLVLLFLSTAFLVGLGIRTVRGTADPPPLSTPDYGRSDSIFFARSSRFLSTPQTPAAVASGRAKTAPATGSININTAAQNELVRLPGIGPAYAGRIIAYRNDHGPFAALEHLQRVKGIGPKTFERIRPFLRLH